MFAQLFCLRLYDELWEQTQSELLPQAIGFFIQLHKTSKGVEIDPRTGQVSVVVVLPPPVPAHSYPVQPSPIYDRLLGEADEHAQANLGAARRKLSVNDIKQDMSPHSTPLSSSILSTSQSALVQPAGSETIVLPAPVVATATETATGPNICICRAAVTELLDYDQRAPRIVRYIEVNQIVHVEQVCATQSGQMRGRLREGGWVSMVNRQGVLQFRPMGKVEGPPPRE